MGSSVQKHVYYQSLRDVPEHLVAEVLDGSLYTSPRPGPKHAAAASGITADVLLFGRRSRGGSDSGGWVILAEPELHLGDEILVPDVAGWRRERMPRLPSEAHFTLAPDWLCEVISPRTARIDRTLKKRAYARHRVGWLWLVDPVVRTLEVLQLAGEFWQEVQLFGGDERVQPQPFEGLAVDLSLWWDGDLDEDSLSG